VGVLPHERRYFLSAIFGALLVAVVDPGGEYAYRMLRLAGFAVGAALVTALGFGIGGGPWGWVVLAAFVATVLGGLAVKYGLHRFVAAYLLNVWFIIALGLGLLRLGPFHTDPWAQALAWLAGSALWIVVTFIMWLVRGRETRPQPVAEIPGDISPRPLTRPIILFAVIRAVAVSAAVAIAFGLHLPNACWTADPVHLRRGGDRRHRHVPGRPAPEAHRQSGTTGTCSPGPGRVNESASRRPGARHTAPATACMTITSTGPPSGTAGAGAGKHGRDTAGSPSWLALTPAVHSQRGRHDR
jgi:hypothetical protein